MAQQKARRPFSADGFSVIELLVVLAVMVIIAAASLPQVISARRLLRFNGLQREVIAHLRFARQTAMSQRQVVRFRYDNTAKRIQIIDNQEVGTLANPLANNPANDVIIKTIPLGTGGVPPNEIIYGSPTGAPTNLSDGINQTALNANMVEIVFQPDGSVLDVNGNPSNSALFFHNSAAAKETAFAITVLGAGGRVKNWRYSKDANLYIQ